MKTPVLRQTGVFFVPGQLLRGKRTWSGALLEIARKALILEGNMLQLQPNE